jgi:hypothetical protein
MVRTKVLKDLKLMFDSKDRVIDLHRYTGELFDVVFDIVSADTFVAGIASKLLAHEAILSEEQAFITNPFFDRHGNWKSSDGKTINLRSAHEVYTVALALEKLRAKYCQALS